MFSARQEHMHFSTLCLASSSSLSCLAQAGASSSPLPHACPLPPHSVGACCAVSALLESTASRRKMNSPAMSTRACSLQIVQLFQWALSCEHGRLATHNWCRVPLYFNNIETCNWTLLCIKIR